MGDIKGTRLWVPVSIYSLPFAQGLREAFP